MTGDIDANELLHLGIACRIAPAPLFIACQPLAEPELASLSLKVPHGQRVGGPNHGFAGRSYGFRPRLVQTSLRPGRVDGGLITALKVNRHIDEERDEEDEKNHPAG